MYIVEIKDKRVNKSYLVLKESFRNFNGKPTSRIVKNYGNINENNRDELMSLAEKDKANQNLTKESELINIKCGRQNSQSSETLNIGYVVLKQIYETLKINKFVETNIKKRSDAFDINSAIKLLIYSRIMKPDSKLDNFKKQGLFFEKFNLKLDNIYDSLTDLFKIDNKLQYHIHSEVSKLYKRDLDLVFYDVTNYFFETEIEDELRAVGVSKEHRASPIVQMGLLMDNQGIPIAYKLFRGNTHDSKTLIDSIEEFQKIFNVQKITLTADKGLNSGSNLEYLISHGHNFIVSQKVRTKDEKFTAKILDQTDYISKTADFKIKDFN
jgi:uncharacterized membrane protein